MNCLTWGEIKKIIAEQEDVKDSDPVYIGVTEEEEGCTTGSTYALESIAFRCGGGPIEFCGSVCGMDDEDEENLS